jgi:FkbM family methyltransferase
MRRLLRRFLRAAPAVAADAAPYEPDLTAAIERLVHEGWTCVDVGAHQGDITATLVRLAGDEGRVVAFEAHPANAEHLRGRFRDVGAIEVVNAAVSDGESETLTLYAGRHDYSTEWNIVGHDVEGVPTRGVLEVQAVSLDNWFPPGEPVHFVKIDVEGAEGLVLAGMRRLLREQRPAIAVEFHDDEGWAARRVLLEAGYTLLGTDGSPLDPDGQRVYHVIAVSAGG